MDITNVKATKSGWLVNEETELPLDYDTKTEEGKALAEWFKTNKAEPLYTPLERAKLSKKTKLTSSKTAEREAGLKVGEYTYFATALDLQKYDHAMKTGKRIAEAEGTAWEEFKGTVKVQEGLMEITGAEFDVALGAIDIFLYKTWYKEQLLHSAVDACNTVEEVEAVVWEEENQGE